MCAGSAPSAGPATWARSPRAARGERHPESRAPGGLRRWAPQLPLPLRAPAGAVVPGFRDRVHVRGDGGPAPARHAARAAVRAGVLARLRALRRERHGARPGAQVLRRLVPAGGRGPHRALRTLLPRRAASRLPRPGHPASPRSEADGVPRIGAGGDGVRGGVDAVHRADSGCDPGPRRDRGEPLQGNGPARRLLAGARGAIPGRRVRGRIVPRLVQAVSALSAMGAAGERCTAGGGRSPHGNRPIHPDRRVAAATHAGGAPTVAVAGRKDGRTESCRTLPPPSVFPSFRLSVLPSSVFRPSVLLAPCERCYSSRLLSGRPDSPQIRPFLAHEKGLAGGPGIPFAHLEEGTMRKILFSVIGVDALAGCSSKPETQAAADSTSRNIQLPKADSAVALNDAPKNAQPQAGLAPPPKTPPARRSSASNAAPPPRPAPGAAPAPAPSPAPEPAPA